VTGEPEHTPALEGAGDERAARRAGLVERWAARHGAAAAERLAAAEELADAVEEATTPDNTEDTYKKAWRVWCRFTAAQGLPELEGSRGALVAYAAWLLHQGRQDGHGYAPAAAQTHLSGTVVQLRSRGVAVSKDAAAAARSALEGLTVQLLKAGERRGRGQAVAADLDGLRAVAAACPDTLAGARDKALLLTSFGYAARASEPAGLLLRDVAVEPQGLVIEVLTGKTRHSVREAVIPYQAHVEVCPVRAWIAWRTRLEDEHGSQAADPDGPAFRAIDRWGHVGGGMSPDSITRAIKRISARARVPIAWTGHSLRAGLATEARKKGRDGVAIAAAGGWAPHSRVMLGYMRRADRWRDNAAAGLM
jgi:integrase